MKKLNKEIRAGNMWVGHSGSRKPNSSKQTTGREDIYAHNDNKSARPADCRNR